jgi:hypothetical protein
MDAPRENITIPPSASKIGFCADLRADLSALLEMREARPDVEHWFCAGDVADRYEALHYNPPALRATCRLEIPSVTGNHDYLVKERQLRELGDERCRERSMRGSVQTASPTRTTRRSRSCDGTQPPLTNGRPAKRRYARALAFGNAAWPRIG